MALLTLGALLATACGQSPRLSEEQRDASLQRKIDESVQEQMDELLLKINSTYAPKSDFNRTNTLWTEMAEVKKNLADLQKGLAVALDKDHDPEQLIAPLRESIAALSARVESAEGDLSVAMDEVFTMRKDLRVILGTLESYRAASRSVLEDQRQALSRQLELLDEVLNAPEEKASN